MISWNLFTNPSPACKGLCCIIRLSNLQSSNVPHEMDVFPWLTLTNREDGALLRECPAAFDTLALSKSKSTECFPKFVTILGTRSKAKLLKRLLGEADSRYSLEQHGQVHLWSDPGSRDTEEPFIYIDCELQNVETPHWRPPTPAVGPDIVRNVVIGSESDRTAGALGARIHANVLAPLSSVVCFVAADLGGVLGVATTLANHVAVSFQCEEDITLPYALVIFDGTSDCELDCAWLRLDIIERVAAILQDSGPTSSEFDPQNPLKSHFSDLRVVELMNEPAKCLYDAVSALSWEVQFKRRSAGLLYNFHHCQAFCELLLHRMCSDDRSPFSFIRSSRAHGFNADELGRHLEELFDLLTTGPQSQFWEVALPLISSALVMASYPPGAHSE